MARAAQLAGGGEPPPAGGAAVAAEDGPLRLQERVAVAAVRLPLPLLLARRPPWRGGDFRPPPQPPAAAPVRWRQRPRGDHGRRRADLHVHRGADGRPAPGSRPRRDRGDGARDARAEAQGTTPAPPPPALVAAAFDARTRDRDVGGLGAGATPGGRRPSPGPAALAPAASVLHAAAAPGCRPRTCARSRVGAAASAAPDVRDPLPVPDFADREEKVSNVRLDC